MKYVKLIAKPNTWFKFGTEVYDYDADYEEKKRVSLDYWEYCKLEGGICVRGIRVIDALYELSLGYTNRGEERIDGEYCDCSEFYVEIIEV